ncbi:MAG: Trk system potassium transporter TrkA [Gammaproteobacteria bacterium]|nr:MAG: Trk system potassium transporter TrkA [Gammaproteobacteria bacterium]PIE37047.1 MAG: Trk system potassium transporter TrkA [Gammaproteobacteria bacterium]
MKIIILGAGQVGSTVARSLADENNEVTVVDTDPVMLRRLEDAADLRTVHGEASHPSVLRDAGAEDADMIVAATSSDETNIVANQIAYTLFRTPVKIARIRSVQYTRETDLFNNDNIPIDMIISPEQEVTEYIQRIIEHPGAAQVVDFAKGQVRMVGVEVTDDAPMVKQPLAHLPELLGRIDTRVMAIYRGDDIIRPDGDSIIEDGDVVYFMGERKHVSRVIDVFHHKMHKNNHVMIAGGGNIGLLVARALERFHSVKVIESQEERAQFIASKLRSAMVFHGDVANQELLIRENIQEMDVFCALTNDDEANILSAMLAKSMGAKMIMSLINRPAYVDLVERDIIDVAVSPQQITIGRLLTSIRRGDVVAVHSLRRGVAEALEGVVHGDADTSRLVGRSIGELPLPDCANIGVVARPEADDSEKLKVLVAHNDLVIEPKDHLIVFVTDKQRIGEVEDLFQVGVTFI